MPLKKAHGNMYPWVTHMHTHLGGECQHKCVYCYVNGVNGKRPEQFCGPIRLIENEFKTSYESGKTIFMEHQNDLFASKVPEEFIVRVVAHALVWPANTYVWQTKNPGRYETAFTITAFPESCIFGTTIETNRAIPGISETPSAEDRVKAMEALRLRRRRLFVTVEPVLDFDVDILAGWIDRIHPEFLNLGADSKSRNLPEPTVEKIMKLVDKLHEYGIDLREKNNLQRLKPA